MNEIPIIRRAVRIFLVDEDNRTFLFKGRGPKNKPEVFWWPVVAELRGLKHPKGQFAEK